MVTPFGVLIDVDTNGTSHHIYDYNKDSLFDLGASLDFPKVAGQFVSWHMDSLQIRDLLLQKNIIQIYDNQATLGVYDLANNGMIAYTYRPLFGSATKIFKYENGASTQIFDDENGTKWSASPLTDGKSIIFQGGDLNSPSTHHQIYLYTGSQTILLSSFDLDLPVSATNPYQINNGFAAYPTVDYAGKTQVWIRDSAGNITQRSF